MLNSKCTNLLLCKIQNVKKKIHDVQVYSHGLVLLEFCVKLHGKLKLIFLFKVQIFPLINGTARGKLCCVLLLL